MDSLTLTALPDFPLVEPGDDLAALIGAALAGCGLDLWDNDVLVVAQKIVSKAENRYVLLADVNPSARARELAEALGKDPRYVEVVLSEATDIVKLGERLLIVAHRLGFVMANAGIDESNIAQEPGAERVLLLPLDPDRSAAELKQALDKQFKASIGVVINDSFGRPWRNGIVGVALGAAGFPALVDLVGAPDLFGRKLKVTEVAAADELASAASLLMGQAQEGKPVVLARGLAAAAAHPNRPAAALVRARERDLFR